MFAPYSDTTLWPTFDISTAGYAKNFVLGFVVADDAMDPSWGGYHKVESNFYSDIIARVLKNKGNLICSFGGASGAELATAIHEVEPLVAAYDLTIQKYNFKFIDFDIEGTAVSNIKANKLRAKAIEKLIAKHKDLHVSLTVPVMPYGFDAHVKKLIEMTPHHLLNIMAMDFGNEKDMFEAVKKSLMAARKFTDKPLGVTVMIGKNDTPEIFTLKDARKLAQFAKENSFIKRLSFWAIERDRGVKGNLDHSSKIDQKPFEFSQIFNSVY